LRKLREQAQGQHDPGPLPAAHRLGRDHPAVFYRDRRDQHRPDPGPAQRAAAPFPGTRTTRPSWSLARGKARTYAAPPSACWPGTRLIT